MGCGGRCHDLQRFSLEKIRGGGGEIESYNISPNTPLSYVSVAQSRTTATASASNPKLPLHATSLQHAFPSSICDSLANSNTLCSVFVNGRSRRVIMEDMERRIKRGDAKQEKLDAIQVGLFPHNEAHADIGCHALLRQNL